MALIKCHECGGQVSSGARTCPHCGKTPKTTFWVGMAFIILFAIASVVAAALQVA